MVLVEQNDFPRAEGVLSDVLAVAKKLPAANPEDRANVAGILNELGLVYGQTRRPADAERAFDQSIQIFSELAQDNPQKNLLAVAPTLNNLAIVYRQTQRITEAESQYRKALDIYDQTLRWNSWRA